MALERGGGSGILKEYTAREKFRALLAAKVNAGNFGTAFARVVFNFDPAIVKLSSEISTNSNMSTVVEKTTILSANSSGRAVIVLATSPSDTAPNGIFEFASFNINANTNLFNFTGDLFFDTFDGQIVDDIGNQLPVTYTNANITVNGIGTETPTPPNFITPTIPAGEVGVFFTPQTVDVPPVTNMKIMMNSGGNSIAFARVVFQFDPSLIKLTSEIATNPNMSTVVEKTTMASANINGRAVIVTATSPTNTAPNGVFEFASFNINSNTTAGNMSADMIFSVIDSQIVDVAGPEIPATYTNAIINVNSGGAVCLRGDIGNLDCSADGCIDTVDVELFRQAYGRTTAEIIVPVGQHTPDLVSDINNTIDTADYEIIRANFGTCQ